MNRMQWALVAVGFGALTLFGFAYCGLAVSLAQMG